MRRYMAKLCGLALAWALLFAALLPLGVSADEARPAARNGSFACYASQFAGGGLQFAEDRGLSAISMAPPDVSAEAYVVMDAATGQVLVAKNENLLEYPASITKIMTLALTLSYVDLEAARNDPVTCSQAAVDALIPRATMIALRPGEVASLNDLLYATKIESANDAANVLAEYVGGSMDSFANLMNGQVRRLGLSGTHFVNASGQPNDEHYTTAYDMAVITRWALTVPGFREVFGATAYEMGGTNLAPGRTFHNANLIQEASSGYYCQGVTGSKTGYTDEARYTLVTTAERDGTELICVSLNNPFNADKYTSTNALLDYCFGNFARVNYPVRDITAHSVPVYGGGQEPLGEIEVFGQGEASFLLHNSLGLDAVETRPEVPERYVIGEDFAPVAALALPEGCTQQKGGQLATVPMGWSGLEGILAANTTAGQPRTLTRMAEARPVLFWAVLAGIALAVGLVAGRIVYVRHRRKKRRLQRLAAARAQMSVRIADRPAPPSRQRQVVGQNRLANPNLRVAPGRAPAADPRRVGRMR